MHGGISIFEKESKMLINESLADFCTEIFDLNFKFKFFNNKTRTAKKFIDK